MLSPPSVDIDGLPRLIPFKYPKTEEQVFTHRSFFARPTAVFEDPPSDPAPDNEVLEYVGDSVLSLAVVTLTKKTYRTCALPYFFKSPSSSHCLTAAGLRVGPHAVSHSYLSLQSGPKSLKHLQKIRSLVVQNVTIARISELYGLSRRLRANQSQLASLQRSVYVQGWFILFSMTPYRLTCGLPPVSQLICLRCVRKLIPDESNPLRQWWFSTGIYRWTI